MDDELPKVIAALPARIDTEKVNQMLSKALGHEPNEKKEMNSSLLAEAAEIETRLRQHVLELIAPTITRQGVLESKLREIRALVDSRNAQMADLMVIKEDAAQVYKIVEDFRSEIADWDMQRRSHEQVSGDRISANESEITSLRRVLEACRADNGSVSRTIIGLSNEVTTARQETTQLRSYAMEKMEMNRDKLAKLRDECEQRMATVENRMHHMQDSQTRGDMIANHTNEKVASLTKQFQEVDVNICDLWRSKASVGNLEAQQSDLSEFMRHTNSTVSALKQQFGSLTEDVKSHFHEAANVVSVTTSIQIEDMRSQYKDEVNSINEVHNHIKSFCQKASEDQRSIEAEVMSIKDAALEATAGLQEKVGALTRKEHVEINSVSVDIGMLRKSIADVKTVLHNQENASGLRGDILELLIESNLLCATCDLQDDHDRRNIALYGYKSADWGKDKSSLLPDVHDDGSHGRANGGSMSARTSKRRGPGVGGASTGTDHSASGSGQVVSLDKRCLSCSGSQGTALAGFKVACLSYAPSDIAIGNSTYNRADLICQRLDMLRHAKDQLKCHSIE